MLSGWSAPTERGVRPAAEPGLERRTVMYRVATRTLLPSLLMLASACGDPNAEMFDDPRAPSSSEAELGLAPGYTEPRTALVEPEGDLDDEGRADLTLHEPPMERLTGSLLDEDLELADADDDVELPAMHLLSGGDGIEVMDLLGLGKDAKDSISTVSNIVTAVSGIK
jgi:hypothetical protein